MRVLRSTLRIIGLMLAVLALGASPAMATQSTQPVKVASAFGSQPIGSFKYSAGGVEINVPAGCFLNHKIDGSGKYITRDFAGVDCAGPAATHPGLFCNYSYGFEYKDTNGKVYMTYKTATVNKCNTITNTGANPNLPRTLPYYGTACVSLYTSGTKRATQCHNIVSN